MYKMMTQRTRLAMVLLVSSAPLAFAIEGKFKDLLPKEELEAIQLEATRQKHKTLKASRGRDSDSKERDGNDPYTPLLKEDDVNPQAQKQEETLTPPVRRSRSSSRSDRYRRYKTGNTRPGDIFKRTPSQRAFGR